MVVERLYDEKSFITMTRSVVPRLHSSCLIRLYSLAVRKQGTTLRRSLPYTKMRHPVSLSQFHPRARVHFRLLCFARVTTPSEVCETACYVTLD